MALSPFEKSSASRQYLGFWRHIDALKSDDLTAILAESGLRRPF